MIMLNVYVKVKDVKVNINDVRGERGKGAR